MPRSKKHKKQSISSLEEIEHKLFERGAFSLSSAELLALLVSSPNVTDPLRTAKQLLLDTGNTLDRLSKTSIGKLSELSYIDNTKAYLLTSALELARRLQVEREHQEARTIEHAHDVKSLMKAYLSELPHEEFWILLLDEGKHLLGKRQISMGGTTAIAIDPKIIFRHVLSEPACSAIVLVHNHPSGRARPSKSDIAITQRILVAAHILGVTVSDHVIYTEDGCYSFKSENRLELPDSFTLKGPKQQKDEHIVSLA